MVLERYRAHGLLERIDGQVRQVAAEGVVPVGRHVKADVLALLPERGDHGALAPARHPRVLELDDLEGDAGAGDALLVVVGQALGERVVGERGPATGSAAARGGEQEHGRDRRDAASEHQDRKSTRLNSSHVSISYAVFCLKKKKYQNLEKRYILTDLKRVREPNQHGTASFAHHT